MTEDQANEKYPIGQKVYYYPIAGDHYHEEAEIRSECWTLGHGEVVVKITGRAGCVSVSHLRAI